MADSEVGKIYYTLDLNKSQFSEGLATSGAEVDQFANKSASIDNVGKSFDSVGKSIKSAGSTFLPFSAAAGLAIGYSAKVAVDFQSQMELIHTQAGASQEEVERMSKAIMALGSTSQQGPLQLSDALYHLESAGLRGKAALDALKAASEGAAVGHADLEQVTNALSGAINSGIPGTENANRAMGILNATVGAGNMRMGDMVAAISTGILPTAKSLGLTFQDVGAGIATMTNAGVPAVDAATRLRMAFSLMAAPTSSAADALATVGIKSTDLANDMRKPDGLHTALVDLKTHLENSGKSAVEQSQIISAAFGGGRTSGTILTLLGATDKLGQSFTTIGKNANSFGNAYAQQSQSAEAHTAAFHAKLQDLGIQMGNTVIPILTQLADKLSSVLSWFEHLSPSTQKVILVILGLVAVMAPLLIVIGSLISAIGVIAGAFTILLGPIGLIVLAVVAVIAIGVLLITHWSEVKAFAERLWHDVAGFFERLWHDVAGFFERMWGDVTGFAARIWADVSGFFIRLVGSVENSVSSLVSGITGFFGSLPGRILGALGNLGSLLFGAGRDIIQGLLNGLGSMASAVTNKISSIAHDVANVAKSVLKVLSPSQVFHDIGMNVGQGLINGVDSMTDQVKQASKDLANTVIQPAQISLAAPNVTAALPFNPASLNSQANANGTVVNNYIYGNIQLANDVQADDFLKKLTRQDQLVAMGLSG